MSARSPPGAQRQAAQAQAPGPVYAGIGARQTPPRILEQMTELASDLADRGWHLHSGGAAGADTAFASGARQHERTLFLPWPAFNGLSGPDCHVARDDVTARHMAIAAALHPAWDRCDARARQFHARNVGILLGPQGNAAVDAAVCWTPGGETVGGTGMAIRIAQAHRIPVINLATTTIDAARTQLDRILAAHPTRAIPNQDIRSTAAPRLRDQASADNRAAKQESTAMVQTMESSPIDPAVERRIAEISERFRGILPEPEQRDELEARLGARDRRTIHRRANSAATARRS